MDQACQICGNSKQDMEKDTESPVLIICDHCLEKDELFPLLDQIFT